MVTILLLFISIPALYVFVALELSNVLEPEAILAVALYSEPLVAALVLLLEDCMWSLIEVTVPAVPAATKAVVAILVELLEAGGVSAVAAPVTFKVPPTFKFSAIPTPPVTLRAPVAIDVDVVCLLYTSDAADE